MIRHVTPISSHGGCGSVPKPALTCWFAIYLLFAMLAHAAPRPNVLLIISDDQGYGDLSLHGNPHVQTPQLDRLGRAGIQFDRFFVSPLCAPTRASLLTGRYSLRTGARGVSRGEETMRAEEVTIAEALRDAGYRTGYFGKWHNGEHFPYTPQGQGFESAYGFNLGHWNNYFDTTLKRDGKPEGTRGYISDVLTDAALRFINTNQATPFFCYVAFNVPHSPFQVPEQDFQRHKKNGLSDFLASVYGMVENMDHNIGRLLARLDELKLRENTIVIFLSDNGPNGARYNAGMRGVKGTLHEGGSRVPFFFSWPARFKEPRTIPQTAAHIDLFPTLVELCGVPMPKTLPLDGRSLVPLLQRTNAWPDRILFNQHMANARGQKTGSLRTERFRLVNDGRGWEIFDMLNDPGQTTDVSSAVPDEKKRLMAAYQQWWKSLDLPSAPKRFPIPVGYKEEPVVELPVPQAEFMGGIRFSGKHPNNAWLTGWTNPAAEVVWELDVVKAGRYDLVLEYLCPSNSPGAHIHITAGESRAEVTLPATPVFQVPSPDRVPRDEVYEFEWSELPAGTLELPRGPVTLRLAAISKPGPMVMDLKSLRLHCRN